MYFLKQRFLEIANILRLEVPLIKTEIFFPSKMFSKLVSKRKKKLFSFLGLLKENSFSIDVPKHLH